MKLEHKKRHAQILGAALKAAGDVGYLKVTKTEVSIRAGVSPSLVQYHFNSIGKLREAILYAAIKERHLPVLAQALGSLNRIALQAPKELKERALQMVIDTEA